MNASLFAACRHPAVRHIGSGWSRAFPIAQFIGRGISVKSDKRTVVADQHARYFGTELREESLVPGGKARIGQTRFEAWLRRPNASR